MTSRPPLVQKALLTLQAIPMLAFLVGCEGLLEVEDASDPVLLAGLGPVDCPAGWTGYELPAPLQTSLDEALGDALLDVQQRIDSEARLRNVGSATSVRLEYLVMHTTSATEILDSQSTLGFMQELSIYIESTRDGSKLDSALIASHALIAETSTAVILKTTKVNLLPYFQEGFRVRTVVLPRSCLASDLQLRLSFRARVRYQDE